ncbi:hypothetical protein QYE76_017727 [Lolium multiflorum]|uniref:Uncharacterized protein n=1 Tax=Lolium multiflorum TaxID=4521 RepID=A0AAD8QGK5_LOLMU|nr:hypothetical protein QYE76_017727 [Lolium multiflorum]
MAPTSSPPREDPSSEVPSIRQRRLAPTVGPEAWRPEQEGSAMGSYDDSIGSNPVKLSIVPIGGIHIFIGETVDSDKLEPPLKRTELVPCRLRRRKTLLRIRKFGKRISGRRVDSGKLKPNFGDTQSMDTEEFDRKVKEYGYGAQPEVDSAQQRSLATIAALENTDQAQTPNRPPSRRGSPMSRERPRRDPTPEDHLSTEDMIAQAAMDAAYPLDVLNTPITPDDVEALEAKRLELLATAKKITAAAILEERKDAEIFVSGYIQREKEVDEGLVKVKELRKHWEDKIVEAHHEVEKLRRDMITPRRITFATPGSNRLPPRDNMTKAAELPKKKDEEIDIDFVRSLLQCGNKARQILHAGWHPTRIFAYPPRRRTPQEINTVMMNRAPVPRSRREAREHPNPIPVPSDSTPRDPTRRAPTKAATGAEPHREDRGEYEAEAGGRIGSRRSPHHHLAVATEVEAEVAEISLSLKIPRHGSRDARERLNEYEPTTSDQSALDDSRGTKAKELPQATGNLKHYDGTERPDTWIEDYYNAVTFAGGTPNIACRMLRLYLGHLQRHLRQATCKPYPEEGRILKKLPYTVVGVQNECENVDHTTPMYAFIGGLQRGGLRHKLTCLANANKLTLDEMISIAATTPPPMTTRRPQQSPYTNKRRIVITAISGHKRKNPMTTRAADPTWSPWRFNAEVQEAEEDAAAVAEPGVNDLKNDPEAGYKRARHRPRGKGGKGKNKDKDEDSSEAMEEDDNSPDPKSGPQLEHHVPGDSERMNLTKEQLKHREFHGVVPGKKANSLGSITLPVAFGDVHNFREERITFEVVPFKSSYHVIFGRPTYHKFHARACYIYNKLKIPGPKGMITVSGDYKKAHECELGEAAFAVVISGEEKGYRAAVDPTEMQTTKKQISKTRRPSRPR